MSDKGTINPITGLPQQNTLNPITGLPFTTAEELGAFKAKVNRQRPQVSVAPGFAATTGDFSSYADRGVTLSGGPSYKDYSTIRALNQSTGEKFLNGAKKGTVTAGSAFVNGLLGVAGTLDFATGSNLNPKSRGSLFGTVQDWTDLVNTEEWRETSRKNNPHYYTKAELDNIGNFNPFSENNSFTWNFLTDKIFDGIGFLVGTAASIYATGGTGVIGRVGQLGNISKGLAAWRTAKTIKSGQSLSKALGTYRTTKNVASKIYNGAAKTEAAFLSAVGEAAIEGKETGKQVYEKLYAEALRKKTAMGLPAQLSAQEVQQLKLQALEAEGAAFYSNVGVLSLSNSIMFRGLFKQFGKAAGTSRWLRPATAAERAANPSLRVVDKLSGLPGYGIRQTAQAARFSAPFLKTMAAEGSEEAAQYAITEGMIEYEMAKMHDSGLGDIVESLIDTNKLRIAAEASPEVASKMLETFSNPEAREQFVIGSIVGILGGGRQGYTESKASRKQRDEQATLLNNEGMFRAARGAESVNKQSFFLQRMNEAEQAGDKEQFEYYQRRLQTEQILQHYNKGSLDLFREMLEDSKSLPENEFKELYGISPETVIDQNKLVDDIVSRSKEIEKSAEMIDELYTSSPTVGAGKLFMSKEEKELEKNNLEDEATYKNYLKLELGSLKFIDGAVSEKVDKIEEMFPGLLTDVLVTQTYKKGKEADYEEGTRTKSVNMRDRIRNYVRNRFGEVALEEGKFTLDVQQNLVKNLNTILANNAEHTEYETIKKELVELRELISQRGNAVTAYNNLNRSPELRDLAISRTKIALEREAQAKRDALVNQIIADTVTPEQLKAKADRVLQQGSISEEARKRANDEIAARAKTRSDAQQKWDTMSRTAVENLEGLSPLLDSYREQYLKDRSQEAPIRDTTVEQKRKADEAAEIIKRRKKEEERLAAEKRKTGQQSAPGQQPNVKLGSQKLDYEKTDAKGRVLTYYSTTTKKDDGTIVVTFQFNRSDKAPSQRAPARMGVPVDVALGDRFTIRTDELENFLNAGAEIDGVREIRIGADGRAAATIIMKQDGERYETEAVLIREEPQVADQGAASTKKDALFTTHSESLNSEVVKDAQGRVVVSSDGVPMDSGLDSERTVNGEPIITDRSLLDSDKVVAGTTLVLEVIEDDWWLGNKGKTQYKNAAAHIPIYVKLPSGEVLGVLTANDSVLRRTVYQEYLKGAQGQQVTVAVAKKYLNNRNNAVVELQDGTTGTFLSRVDEVFGNTPLGVVTYAKNLSKKGLTVANTQGLTQEDLDAIAELSSEVTSDKVRYGQVVALHKDSNGKWKYSLLQTARLTEAEQEEAFNLLLDSSPESYQKLVDEVGLNTLNPAEVGEVSATYLQVEKDYMRNADKRMIRFAVPIGSVKSEMARADLENGMFVVALDNRTLTNLADPSTAEATAKAILNGKKGTTEAGILGNLIQKLVEKEDGFVNPEGRGFQIVKEDMSKEEALAFIMSLPKAVQRTLKNKRKQVDINRLNADPSYYNTLVEETREDPLPLQTIFGHRGVIMTDVVLHNGSMYNGIGLEFDLSQLKIGNKKPKANDIKVSRPISTAEANDAQALFDAAAKARAQEVGPEEVGPEEAGEQEFDPDQVTDDDIAGARVPTKEEIEAIRAALRQQREGGVDPNQGTDNNQETHPDEDRLNDVEVDDDAFRLSPDKGKRLNKAQAAAWLKQRNIPVEFYEIAKQVGSKVAHGYMKNAAVYLWNNAEVGTEYHEAFHYVFRTSLSDKQREGLYKEARKRFDLPNAKELELEERMAEEFRDYVFTAQETGKTLPGKIRKFFSDLWNFIKALFVNPVGVEQFYSLIESNKVPKKYERSAEKFETKGEVYRLVSDLGNDYELQQQVIDIISMLFVDTYNESNEIVKGVSALEGTGKDNKVLAAALLGTTEDNKGIIADWFLEHSFATETDDYMSNEAMDAIKNAKSSEEIKKAVKKYKLQRKPPLQALFASELPGTVFKKPEKTQRKTAVIFYNVWKNWFDVTDELGNIEQYGWRDAAAADLLKYGFNIQTRVATRTALEQEEEGSPEQEEVNFDKIYDISHFEQDPLKVASKEVRNLLSRIVDTTPNVFGIPTYIDIEATLRKTIAVTAGAKGYSEILGRIQEAARIEEIEAQKTDRKSLILGPLKDYLNGTPTAQEVAALTRFLTKTYSELRIVQENQIETTDGKEEMSVQTINSDRKSAVINWQDTWKNDGLQTLSVPRPGAVFTETENGGIAFNNNIVEGKERIQVLKEAFLKYDKANTLEDKATQLGKIMWNLSLGMGSTEQEATDRLMSYVLKNTTLDNNEISKIFKKVIYLANQAVDFKVEGGRVKDVMLKKGKVRNFFVSEGSTVKELANIAAEYSVPVAIAYVNGKGKTIYPYNLPTPFTDLIEDLKQNAASKKYAFLQGDESFTAMNTEHKAMLMTLIANPEFEISSWALDTINNEASDDANIEYKKMSERDSLILKLNMFVNQGSAIKYGWIPVSTQETRGRLDFVKFPKIEENDYRAVEAAGLQRKTFSERLKSVVIRDLVRLSNNPRVAENYNNGFHLTGIVNTKLDSGLLMSETVKDYLQNPKGKDYQDFNKELDRQVKEYINTVFKRNRENLRNELLRYNIIRLVEGKPEFLEMSKLDSSVQKYGGVNRFLNNYMMTDLLARIEMAEMLRGGVVQFKDLTKFYKRMGLIQTPGDKLMQKGEYEKDPDYGMAPTIVEASIGRIQNQEPFHNVAADRLRDLVLVPHFEETMSPEKAFEKAEGIAKQYRNDFGDHTDAQGFASDIYYKMFKQGKGQWTSEDDVWFDAYLKGAEWKGDKYIEPIKPFVNNQVMENGASISDMQKNSLLVVTRPLAEMNTVLLAMYLRMNKPGDNIHIINTESAKKGAQGQMFVVNQELGENMFEGLEGTEMSTDGLYIPQIISDKQSETAKMNRQIRKVLPTMVKADGKYDVKGAKSPMSGKEVSDRYQALHEEILDAQAKKLFKELGWDELKKNPGNKEARLKFLQRVKSVIMDNAMKNNKLDSNLDKQLRIVEDMVNNTVDFNVPTYMPVYQRQLQNQIFSLFRSNVYQVKLPGRDLVQANAGGKWKIGNTATAAKRNGVDELFENNPELAAIGTPEQYSAYLDSIFPDSKVKDIVYHGSNQKQAPNELRSTASSNFVYVSEEKSYADVYSKRGGGNTFQAIVNAQNLLNVRTLLTDKNSELARRFEEFLYDNPGNGYSVEDYLEADPKSFTDLVPLTNRKFLAEFYKQEGYDGLTGWNEKALFEPKQVHILGSKKDIAGFKEFAKQGKGKGAVIRELRHLHIDEEGNTVAAEIMISEDLAEMHGIKVGDRIIMYRIPNQDYSSAVPSKVAGILPRGYSKTVIVAGGITIQTGSDFDIDKLFNLFENKNPKNRLDRLKNELFNISYSILMNKETAPYLFAPLNQDTLNDLADNPAIAREEVRDFDDPLVEIKMESNYKSAATLVGGYANAIAGMSIANVASQFENEEYVQDGIAVNASKKFILNDKPLGFISTTSDLTNERNIAGIVERLSAALDAGSKLIHSTLNDNDITLNATVYLKSIGFGDRDVVALMTTPLVREFVESKRDNRNKSNQRVFQELGISRKTYSKIAAFDSSIMPPALNTEELERVSREGDRKDPVAKEALYAFAHALVAGNSLSDFYRVIAADNLDGMGDLAEIEAYLDVLDNYKRSGNRNIVGYSEVEKILKGDAYRISRAFFNIIDESMQISSELFMSGTKGVREFKQLLKDVAGKQTMTAAEHRFVDRALFYHIFTKEGSPIGSLMQKSVVKSMLLDPKNNLYKQVKDLIEEIPALKSNSMIASIKEGPKYNDPTTRVFGISIENTEKMSLRARESQRQSFGDLLYRPEKYTSDPEEQKKIQNMGKRLVLNSIVTTGLAPSYGTYYDAIPIEFFMEIADENGKTLMQYLREEFQNVKNDERYFDDFMFSFMQNYGAATVASAPLVGRMPRSYVQRGEGLYGLPASVELDGRPARYVTRANYSKGVDKISVYEYNNTDEMYHPIQSMSITNKIIELNLRDKNGDIVTSSFFAESQGERKVRIAGKGKGKDKVVDLHSRAGITKTMSDPMTMNEEARRIRTTDSSSDISHVC
jgi:hypothetical protein